MIHPFEERLEVVKLTLSGYPLKKLCHERNHPTIPQGHVSLLVLTISKDVSDTEYYTQADIKMLK